MTFHRCIALLLLALSPNITQAAERLLLPRSDGHKTPVMHYAPIGVCLGTAIISHGAGGSENGLSYLGEFLQSKGWRTIVLGHAESGRTALRAKIPGMDIKAGLGALITDPAAYRGRFADIEAALAWQKSRCKNPFTALIGHSMGAATVMLAAGAENKLGLRTRIGFDAYVAMSPQGVGRIFPVNAWRGITAPVYALTGTEDKELNAGWESRLEAYKSMPPGCKWQGVIAGANHMAFGRGGSDSEMALITGSVLSFLEKAKARDCRQAFAAPGIRMEHK
jgi:dienelactone hydrolase